MKSKGPSKSIYTRFKPSWPMHYENVQKNMDQLLKFPWCEVSGTPLEDKAKKVYLFAKKLWNFILSSESIINFCVNMSLFFWKEGLLGL